MTEANALAKQLSSKSSLTLYATKTAINAAQEAMIPTTTAWSDADSLVAALADPESREVGARYLARTRKR